MTRSRQAVHRLFEAQAGRTPDAVAVVFEGERLAYRELNGRANRLARRLRRLGVGTDTLVPVLLERSPRMAIAILGVMKAGAAWLPLDPDDPKERLALMLAGAQPAVVLTEERLVGRLSSFRGPVVVIDRPGDDIDRECDDNLDASIDDGAIDDAATAYAIYTSGSTGAPKGVLVPHAAILNHTLWMQETFPLGPADGVVQKTPFTFDAAVWEFLAPLIAGARLIVARPGDHRDPASLVRLIARERATIFQTVPSALRLLLDEPGVDRCRSLRRVFCGGEALTPDLVERFFGRLSAELVNLYGPTEACIDSAFRVCGRGERTVPIGRPIEGARAYVLDARLRPLPEGAQGELYIAGAGLARGYLGRPDLTAERFLPDPFSREPGARMYATGDRARRLSGGALEYLGRADDQVKVRGHRIEPGEIECALGRHPAVRECAVVARPDRRGDATLAAYVVPRDRTGPRPPVPTVGALRAYLADTLPEAMVPSSFVFLDELPRTAGGKIDRRRLPAIGGGRPDLATPYVAPRNDDEGSMAALWSELLEIDRVGVADDFFDLGGHSLVATRLISRLRDLWGVELPLRLLFEAPTVEGLAARVEAARREGRRAGTPVPAPGGPDRERPLSFAQERLWFLDQLDPAHPFYNMPSTLRLRGALDSGALERSLDEIVRRHEILRTTFPAVDGRPVAVVSHGLRIGLPVDDLTGWPPGDRWPEALRRARREAQAPFNLARGPLLRARLLRLDAADHVLLLTFHHIVTDGWSEGVFNRELGSLYGALKEGRPSPLSDPPIQYADFAAWQRGVLRGRVLEEQIAYWRAALAGAPFVLDLPTDRPRPAARSHRGARERVEIPEPLSDALRRLARGEGATPFMTILAAFDVVLRAHTGQDDILVGTPIANRSRLEIEDLIGFFVNTLVLRADLSGDPTFRELLGRVRRAALDAYAHQDLPFEKLVETLRPPRDLGRSALFQVMVAQAATPVIELADLETEFVDIDDGISKFDLTLDVDDSRARLACALEYSTDLFEAATARRFLTHLETLLHGIAADPDRRLSHLPLLPPAERAQVLVEWSGGPAEPPPDRPVHELIRARAAGAPEAIAVSGETGRLDYAGLEDRAAALARRLHRLGVRAESAVGLCVERSPEMIVGLLAILKAGGAYVPLDPAYPRERLAHVLEDTDARVILAQGRLVAGLPPTGARIVTFDEEDTHAGRGDGDLPAPAAENLAYVVYTSGSTGPAKGVLVPHRALANHCFAVARRYGLRSSDRVLQFAAPSFDVAAEEIFPTLLSGATLVLRPDPVFVSVPDFHRFLESERVTVVNLPSSYWHAWVAELEREDRPLPSCLRCVVIGSEKALASRLAAWSEIAGDRVALFNAYGPTEATITTTVYEPARSRSVGREGLVPIGRPIANARVYVLDRPMNAVPVGVPGELHIGGEGVARGYRRRPDRTAERFVPDPFSGAPGARLYRTGDRVRWLADGNLEFLGRLDDQVKVRGHRIEPGEIERALERHPAVSEAAVLARDDPSGGTRLAGYVVPRPGADPAPSTAGLRAHLKELLPEHMIPAAFVVLSKMPRTPAGKIDRKALPAPDPGTRDIAAEPVAPRTPAEKTLAGIWSALFGGKVIGVHDNFFELGGDSILSIQIVARANQAGLRLTSRQVFQHQTVAALAAVAGSRAGVAAEQGEVKGEAPLTPIQRWFFEHDFADPHHFNQAVLLQARQAIDATRLERALGVLLEHHDALRMRFRRTRGEWRQVNAAAGGSVPFERIDLSAVADEGLAAALESEGAAQQARLDLTEGPLLRAALFDLGRGRGMRLLIVIHHLVVDGVSWRILLDDLSTVYRQLERGDSIALPPKTTSYRDWAARLARHAATAPLERELEFWLDEARRRAGSIPADYPGGDNSEGSARVVASAFSEEETRALLQDLPGRWRTEVNDVLLTALARAVIDRTGARSVLIDLEGHGREEILDDVDLSRTVGWFTSIKPVLLFLRDGDGPGESLRSIKEQLRAMPARGIGYGLLRYLDAGGRARASLEALPQAAISFNYLGQFDATVPESSPFRFAPESTGPVVSPRGRRTHLLEVGGYVVSGRLRISWKYGANLHARATIESLARRFEAELRSLVALGRRAGPIGYTPSDFPLAAIDQGSLDALAGARPDLEDVYPLTPMQEGMLYHTLAAPGSGVYVEHLAWRFHGPLDEGALERAWRHLTRRHPILRTALVWSGVDRPLQIVGRDVRPSWERLDWSGLDGPGRERALRQFLADDMRRGYDLARPPLQRLALARVADGVHQFIWSHHHVLLDGWSLPILLREVMSLYESCRREEEPRLEDVRPFRDYVAWLRKQDAAAAETFWKGALRGFATPTSLVVDRPASRAVRPEDYRLARARLDDGTFTALKELARRHQLTLNTALQGAWALLLGRYGGADDVVFGGVVSGRPADLDGAERMVGLFLNTLPVRVRLDRRERVVPWLKRLQDEQAEMRQYEYAPLVEVQRWSEVPPGTPLFESVFVFENYPLDRSLLERSGDLEIRDLRAVEWTHYPLTVVVPPGPDLSIQINYDARRFDDAAVRRMLGHLTTLLEGMAAGPERRLGDLPMLAAAEGGRAASRGAPRAAPQSAPRTAPRGLPAGCCLHERFEAQAARTPAAVAVVHDDGRLSYAGLNRRANRLARRLRDLGVKPETRVAIGLERSIDMIVAILAVHKAGGAYVPLDPAYPRDRLAYMVQDAGARVLIATRSVLDRLPEVAGAVVLLDEERDLPGDGCETDLPPSAVPGNAAYVIYTSGSTGRPKGVMVTHANVTSLFDAMAPVFGFGDGDVWTLFHSFAFDYSVWEMWGALLHGGRLVIVPPLVGQSPEAFRALLRRERVTVLNQTPSSFRQLIRADESAADDLDLRLVNIGGEALNLDDLKPWVARRPERPQLVNLYGITETTVIVTCRPLAPEDFRGRPGSVIGRPIDSLSVRLLDPSMQEVPIGVPGEIYVGGAGLARGYLGRPDLTAERFVPDPFGEAPGARLYRSGDLARRLEDGDLEYLGRIDDQIKIRGFRIEPGEIEAALLAHPDVRETAVVARRDGGQRTGDGGRETRDGGRETRVVAYVVPRPGAEATPVSLRAFLKTSLPDYMVPSAVVMLQTLPVTPNGKVDRRALPSPETAPPTPAAERVPPRTPMEEEVARLWSGLLGVAQPGVEDNFFEAGGQSLLATLLISRVRAQLGAEVSLKDFLDRPTIRGLAERVEASLLEAVVPSELDAMLGLLDGKSDAPGRAAAPPADVPETRRVEEL